MGFIDRTLAAFGYVKAGEAQTVMGGEIPFGFIGDYNWREDGTTVWTEERLKRYAQQSSWVFSDVDLIANTFSVAELQVFRKKGEELKAVYDHDFEKIIETPSAIEFIDASFLWKFSLTYGLLHGEIYWLLNTDRTGVLRELIPIPSDRIWPVPDPKEYISHFNYQPTNGGQPVPLPRDKVFFWRRPGRSFHRGQSLFEPLNRPLETDVAASQWNVDTFKKGLSLQTVLGLPDTLSNALFEQAKSDIERAMTEEQRRFLITRSGQVSAQTVGVTHKDAEFLSMRDMTRKEIDRIFGIPEGYWSEKATRANAEAAHIGLYRHAIMPLRVSVQRAITAQIMRRFYGDDLRARFKDDIPPDQSTWEAKTLDEVRADIGLPPWHNKEQGKTLFPLAKTGKWEGEGQPNGGAGGAQPPPPGASPDGDKTPPRPGKDGGEDDQTPPAGKQPAGADGQQPAPKDQPTAAPAAGNDKPEAKGYTSLDLTDAPLTIPNPVETDGELKADLRRWRSIARREAKAGSNPASRHFHSHAIPEWMQVDIMVGLREAGDEAAVKAVFDNVLEAKAVTFIPRGAADPLPALGDGLPLGEPGREAEDEAALQAAVTAWDRTMPEYAGLLDARPVGALVGAPALGLAEFAGVKAYTLVDDGD